MRLTPGVKTLLQVLAVARHAETEDPIDHGGEDIAFRRHAEPGGIDGSLLHAAKKIEQADNDHQAGIFKQRDNGINQSRDRQL